MSKLAYEKLIKKSLKSRIPSYESDINYYWDAKFFGLDQVDAFKVLNLEQQSKALQNCSQSLLAEGIHIENRGIDLTSFMISKSNVMEEKHIYSLINADEIEHYYLLSRFLFQEIYPENENAFIVLLKECINSADSYMMVFFLQVILEGWGMSYYNLLGKGCLDLELKKSIDRIIFDESSHHGTGLVYYKQHDQQSRKQLDMMTDLLATFLHMLRVGPQTIVGHLEREHGGLSAIQREMIFQQMNSYTDTQWRLDNIKKLLRHDLSNTLITRLEKLDLFKAMNPGECARMSI